MGGYVRQKVYKLVWPEGAELEGLEVRVSATSIKNYMVAVAILDNDPPDSFVDEEGELYEFKDNGDRQFEFIVRKFSKGLLSWNLTTPDDEEIKAVEAEVWNQDREFVLIVTRAWLDALASVSRPLPKPSPAGQPLAGVSIPMETLSESPES
jgi:hypothetical protein